MITYLGSEPFGERFAALSLAVDADMPSTEILFISSECTVADTTFRQPIDLPKTNHEMNVERAFLAEWDAMRQPLSTGLLESVGSWLDEKDVLTALVRSEKGHGFGTILAAGRADILRTLIEVRAAALYDRVMDGTPPSIMISRIPHGSQLEVLTTAGNGPGDLWAMRLQAERGIETSTWTSTDGAALLIDAGGPAIDPHNPWATLEDNPIEQRVALGRVFNRVCEARRPFDWVHLLTTRGDVERFQQECRLRYPDTAQRLLDAAVETMKMSDTGAGPPASDVTQVAGSSSRVRARQVIGSPGNAGEAAGIVTYDPLAADDKVLFCDHVTARIWKMRPKAAAIVERYGSGFGHGAVLSCDQGIPHVYGAADLQLVPEGATVAVNGELGIVINNTQT